LGILDFVTMPTKKNSTAHQKYFGQQDWCMTGNPGVLNLFDKFLPCMTGNPGVLNLFDKFLPFKEKLLGDLEEDKPC